VSDQSEVLTGEARIMRQLERGLITEAEAKWKLLELAAAGGAA
jgi:hypothetical protein